MRMVPKDFFVGAATAAHQVEGNNIHSDYWAMEQMKYAGFAEKSLSAVDHYQLYEEDIQLMAKAGLNAYRFSIEWARIEPQKGVFDKNEIEHYRKVLLCCRENQIEPFVTLLHFTSPKWLITNGGWEDEKTIDAFANYSKYVIEQLGDLVNYVCTINEANMGLQVAKIAERYKMMMSQKQNHQNSEDKNVEGNVQVGINMKAMLENMQKQKKENVEVFGTETPQIFVSSRTDQGDNLVMRAHQAASNVMKEIKPELKVGLTLSLHDIQVLPGGEQLAQEEWDAEFIHYIPFIKNDDFLGIQNYTRSLVNADGTLPCPEDAELTQMGYEFYPQALENVIRKAHKDLDIPFIVTENGVATEDDTQREAFIEVAVNGVMNCVDDGIKVDGYLYWSLLDNFEWQKGYSMTFGLISVDRTTMKRNPKPSLEKLGQLRV